MANKEQRKQEELNAQVWTVPWEQLPRFGNKSLLLLQFVELSLCCHWSGLHRTSKSARDRKARCGWEYQKIDKDGPRGIVTLSTLLQPQQKAQH